MARSMIRRGEKSEEEMNGTLRGYWGCKRPLFLISGQGDIDEYLGVKVRRNGLKRMEKANDRPTMKYSRKFNNSFNKEQITSVDLDTT